MIGNVLVGILLAGPIWAIATFTVILYEDCVNK
jgi:hypothetical protein